MRWKKSGDDPIWILNKLWGGSGSGDDPISILDKLREWYCHWMIFYAESQLIQYEY